MTAHRTVILSGGAPTPSATKLEAPQPSRRPDSTPDFTYHEHLFSTRAADTTAPTPSSPESIHEIRS
jgi:hypothetical protein